MPVNSMPANAGIQGIENSGSRHSPGWRKTNWSEVPLN